MLPTLTLGLAVLLSPPLPAQQQEQKKEPAPERQDEDIRIVPEIVVTATRTPEDVLDVPRSVTILDEVDLRELAPRTPAEALRFQPGIWVQKTGHLGGAPIIRGFMGNQVVYLFDGIRRNTASLFAGPNSFLQNIDALDVDRIEVIRGPGSVLYGSDAIGGVINVISNEELDFTPALDWGGRALGRFGSADYETSGRIEGRISTSRFNAFIGGTRRNLQDLRAGRGGGLQTPGSWSEHDWDGQFGWNLGQQQRLDFYVQSFYRPEGTRYDRPNWIQTNERDMYTARFRGKDYDFAKSVDVKAWYHSQKNFIDEKYWDSDSVDRTVGAEAVLESQFRDGLSLTYGFTAYQDSVSKWNPQAGTATPSVDWLDVGAFGLAKWDARDDVRVDIGLRVERFTLNSTAPPTSQLDSEVQDALSNGALTQEDLNLDQTNVALTGGVGVSWYVDDETTLYSHLGRAFRAPNKNDMLNFGAFTFGFNVPSANVDPETSWSYEVGMKKQTHDSAFAIAAYYTLVQDGIISEPGSFNGSSFIDVNGNGVEDAGEQVYVKTNSPDDIYVYGVELQGTHYLPRQWTRPVFDDTEVSLYGNFTWLTGRDKGTDEPIDRAFPMNALLGIRFEDSRYAVKRRWWAAVEAWMVDRFSRIPSDRLGDPAFLLDPQDSGSGFLAPGPSVPGYTIFTARGGVRINDAADFTLAIQNVTDKLYRVKDSRINAPGVNVVAALEVRF